MCWGSSVKGSGEVIRASAPYTSGWGSFVLLKMDRVRLAWGGSLSMLHWTLALENAKTPTPQGRGWGYTGES